MMVKLRAGKVKVECDLTEDSIMYTLKFPYNVQLKDDIKAMHGARWNPSDKSWTVPRSPSNDFRMRFHKGENVFARYDKPFELFESRRKMREHQMPMAQHLITRRQCILAGEMGIGKTLVAIEVMEHVQPTDCWYIAPRSVLTGIELEFMKWKCLIRPKMITYEGLVKILKDWKDGDRPPQMLIGDEISRCKSPRAQRTQAMMHLANSMRATWGEEAYVILMSGSPAPKSPADWWALAQIACPGFLRETDYFKFQARLSIQQQMEGNDGVKFNKIISWKDNSSKCTSCAKPRMDFIHSPEAVAINESAHEFVGCENEVEKLHRRLSGLVYVKFKRDCLDLPEKVYRTVKVRSTIATLNAAKMLATTLTCAHLLMKLRELSDGFQYSEVRGVEETCPRCLGTREIGEPAVPCHACEAVGMVRPWITELKEVACPKDAAVVDLLDEHEEDGRLVLYAGFTPSIDRLVRIIKAEGWNYVRVDGRGWDTDLPFTDRTDMLSAFQNLEEGNYPKVAFIGHPGSAGMGLTLTASRSIVYYSNDFNAESRIQSEDRIHRLGSRGANIIDIVHLPTDQRVLENLQAKRDLQSISLGDIKEALNSDEL